MASKRKRLNKQTLFLLGGVLGVETVGCVGVGMSIHNRKTAMEATLKGKETALANVRTVSASLPAMRVQYDKMQAQVQYLERSLPPAEYIPTLLGQVEQTAIGCGIKIQDFRPKATQNAGAEAGDEKDKSGGDGTTQQQFDMTVIGSYAQIQNFLQALTRFHKVLAVNSIRISPGSGNKTGGAPQLSTALSLTAFVLPPAPQLPTISGNGPSPAPGTAAKAVQHSASAAPSAPAGSQGSKSEQGLSAAAKLAAREGINVGHGAADQAAPRG